MKPITHTLCVAILATTFAATAAISAQDIPATTAQGSITVNGNRTEFHYAYVVTRTSLASKKPETVLIISDKPVAANAVADDTERMVAQRRDGLNLIELKFDEKNTLVGTNFEVAPLVVSAYSTEFKMNIERFTDTQLAGRFNSSSEHKMQNNTYAFDVRFNASMIAPAAGL